ncbi:hypothetical protein ACNBFH_004433 [Salmonella enterica subsp. enterica serovar Bareilly]
MIRISYRNAGAEQARRIALTALNTGDHRRWALAMKLLRRAMLIHTIEQEAAQ